MLLVMREGDPDAGAPLPPLQRSGTTSSGHCGRQLGVRQAGKQGGVSACTDFRAVFH